MEINPYAAPQSEVLQIDTEDEVIRRKHIETEAALKSVGFLYYFGAFFMIFAGVMGLRGIPLQGMEGASPVVVGAILLILGVGQGIAAYGIRRLKSWSRIPTAIFATIGLLGFPIGTLISIYVLVKLSSAQGKFVMTPEYHRIMAATPHVKRKSGILKLFVIVLLIIIVIGIVVALLA